MDDVRSLVRLVEHAPMPDLWRDVASRIPGPLPPQPGPRRTIAVVVAMAVAAAGFVVAYQVFRPLGNPTPTAKPESTRPLTGEPIVSARIPVRDGLAAGSLAVGAGAVWVGLEEGIIDDHRGGSIGRIDLATNEIVAEIPLEGGSPWSGGRIAATDQAVWVTGDHEVVRIDPATNEVAAVVELVDRGIAAIAADATAVWALTTVPASDGGGEFAGRLVRIDPRSNAIVADIPLGSYPVGLDNELRLGAGSVWLLGVRFSEAESAEYGSDLLRVDPATNTIVARIPVHGVHMAVGPDEVWVRFPADGVVDDPDDTWLWTRVDVSTNQPSPPFAFDDATVRHKGLRLVTPEALWSVGYDDQDDVRVTSFDPATLDVWARSAPIDHSFHDAVVDPATRTVWIATGEAIIRLDIA